MATGALTRKSIAQIESEIRDAENDDVGRQGFIKIATIDMPDSPAGKKLLQNKIQVSVKMAAEEVINHSRFFEAIATTTAGAAMGVHAQKPSLVFPTSLAALLTDTTVNVTIPPGSNTARWATFTHLPFGATSQNSEPSQAIQTLTTKDAVAAPYGVEQQISFEAFRKSPGIMKAMVTAAQVGEMIQRDTLVLNEADSVTGIAATIYGGGAANEAAIISTSTMSSANLIDAIEDLTAQGYTADDLVWVGYQNQFDALLKDSGLTKVPTYQDFELLGNGIAYIHGVECRRSNLVATGTGSASITTYHSSLFKKNYTFGFGNSTQLTIEWYRDIRANSLWFKAWIDAAAKTLAPLSLVKIITA